MNEMKLGMGISTVSPRVAGKTAVPPIEIAELK